MERESKDTKKQIVRLIRKGLSNEEIAKRTKQKVESIPGIKANLTKTSKKRKIRNGPFLILECTPEALNGYQNEGAFVKEMAKIFNPMADPRVVPVQTSSTFLALLNEPYSVLHISTHGRNYLSNHNVISHKGTIVAFSDGSYVTAEEIKQELLKKKPKDRPKLLILSACQTGSDEMALALKGVCEYFIAPTEKTTWLDSTIFSTLFYRLLFVEDSTPWKAFDRTDKAFKKLLHKNYSGIWNIYHGDKQCFSSEGRRRLEIRIEDPKIKTHHE